MNSKKVMEYHNMQEQCTTEIRKILSKYGYRNTKEQYVRAFGKMCDMGMNAWPKETTQTEAIEDYKRFIECVSNPFTLQCEIIREAQQLKEESNAKHRTTY